MGKKKKKKKNERKESKTGNRRVFIFDRRSGWGLKYIDQMTLPKKRKKKGR